MQERRGATRSIKQVTRALRLSAYEEGKVFFYVIMNRRRTASTILFMLLLLSYPLRD